MSDEPDIEIDNDEIEIDVEDVSLKYDLNKIIIPDDLMCSSVDCEYPWDDENAKKAVLSNIVTVMGGPEEMTKNMSDMAQGGSGYITAALRTAKNMARINIHEKLYEKGVVDDKPKELKHTEMTQELFDFKEIGGKYYCSDCASEFHGH